MRYEIMLDLYAQVDAVYTGIAVMLLFLLTTWLVSKLLPSKVRPCFRSGVIVLAGIEYVGLFLFAVSGAVR